MEQQDIVPDSERRRMVLWLPRKLADLVQLARFDRPIGAWLLYWPGAWSIALANGVAFRWTLLLWFVLGAVAMRGAGCVYNDIVDRDLDARVARTAARPVASGRVSLKLAWGWLVALCLVGLVVLLQLPPVAQLTALASLGLVAAYPFMKRITGFPQAWLGLVFSWAALVGWPAVTGGLDWVTLWLWIGSGCWVVGYDTIYALQDVEDDALVGIGSSARALGRHVRLGVALFYAGAVAGWAVAFWLRRPDPVALLALLPVAAHLCWQVVRLRQGDEALALRLFRSNRPAGFWMFLGCLVVGATA